MKHFVLFSFVLLLPSSLLCPSLLQCSSCCRFRFPLLLCLIPVRLRCFPSPPAVIVAVVSLSCTRRVRLWSSSSVAFFCSGLRCVSGTSRSLVFTLISCPRSLTAESRRDEFLPINRMCSSTFCSKSWYLMKPCIDTVEYSMHLVQAELDVSHPLLLIPLFRVHGWCDSDFF